MKGQTTTIKLAVEILTPVHVGSGEELHHELDYVKRDGQTFIVDQDRTFNAIASGNAKLDTLQQADPNLSDLVGLSDEYHGYSLPDLSQQSSDVPKRIKAQIKGAMLQPYLPGSSIKGAIRTALLAEWLRGKPGEVTNHLPQQNNGPKRAATAITKHIFGPDPNKDLLRALHVGDANFQTDDLCLADIRWLNITIFGGNERAKWRNMSNRRNEDRWQNATGIFVEALASKAIAKMALQWDGFLLDDTERWRAPRHSIELLPEDFAGLRTKLNKHAQYILERERSFFEGYRQPLIVEQFNTLLRGIQQTDNAAYLRLAWGSGWRGMTGDWLDEQTQEEMRQLYRLGRSETFPKTRRLAVRDTPCLPLGWIKLSPWSDEMERHVGTQKPGQTNVPASPWVEQQIATLQKQHRISDDEALRGQSLAKSWQSIEDNDLKQAALEDIRARWQKRGWWDNPPSGRSVRKALQIYKGEN